MELQTFEQYFDQLYVLNLRERRDRRHQITRELAHAGLPLLPGRREILISDRPKEAAGFPNVGYRGCFTSHLNALKKAAAAQAKNVIIVEDDLVVSPRFIQDADSLVSQIGDAPWGLIYLGHGLDDPARDEATIIKPYLEQVMLGHFYAINSSIFDKMIAYMEAILTRPPGHPDGGPQAHDGAMWMFRQKHPEVMTLVTSPNLGWQRSSKSDNMPKWFDQIPVLGTAAGVARRAKSWLAGT